MSWNRRRKKTGGGERPFGQGGSGKAKSFRRAFTKAKTFIHKGEEDYSGISVRDWEFKSRSWGKGRRKVPMNYEQ